MKDYTHIVFVLDKSGSMNRMYDEALGGFNSLVREQANQEGKCTLSLYQFDHGFSNTFDFAEVNENLKLTKDQYRLGGTTALIDALYKAITRTQARISEMPEEEQPELVMLVVLTDGDENASRTYTRDQVKALIEELESTNWKASYLGAGLNAVSESKSMGFASQSMAVFDATPTAAASAFKSAGSLINETRSAVRNHGIESRLSTSYSAAQRKNMSSR